MTLLRVDECSGLERDYVEEVLAIVLQHCDFFNQLVDVDAILFDARAVLVHDLLTDVTFGVLGHALLA